MKSVLNNHVVGHPETGKVITFFTKVDKQGVEQTYGKVRLDSASLSISNGFVTSKKRTAFVTLDSTALEQLQDQIVGGKPFPTQGQIVVLETLYPQWESQSPKMNPRTGEIIEINGFHIYRSTLFTSDMDAKDVFITPFNLQDHLGSIGSEQQIIEDELVM